MKKLKSIFSCVLSLAIIGAVSMTAFAETPKKPENGTYLCDIEWKSWWMLESTSEDESPKYQPVKNEEVNGDKLTIGGVVYDKGLVSHPNPDNGDQKGDCGFVYDISGKDCNRFYAVAGKTLAGSVGHNIQFQVIGDGKVLADSGIVGPKQGYVFDVDITGVKELTLKALTGDDNYYDDGCAWGDPIIYKKAAAENGGETPPKTGDAGMTPFVFVAIAAAAAGVWAMGAKKQRAR